MMRTIIISDVHIGDSRLRDESSIVSLLKNEDIYDRLILNGDIVDTWLLGYKKAVKNSAIAQTILDINTRKKVIWIAGNHDPIEQHQNILPGVKVYNMYRFDKYYLALHGHQVYAFYDRVWLYKIAANIHSWLYKLIKIDFQSIICNSPLYIEYTKGKRQEIINNFGNPGDSIFMGHSHLKHIQSTNDITIYDGGSTMLDKTYIYIDELGKIHHKVIEE